MRTFTLDWNCIIAMEQKETAATAVRALVDANASGDAHVAVVAISASERQNPSVRFQLSNNFRNAWPRSI
jgi:hypothetical protein